MDIESLWEEASKNAGLSDGRVEGTRIGEDWFYYCLERNNVEFLFGTLKVQSFRIGEDWFYYFSERNNVVALFGTLKVQSFILTEVSDCGLLIVVTSSTFLKRKDMLKEKKAVSPDHQNLQPSKYIDKCNLYTYTVYMYTAL